MPLEISRLLAPLFAAPVAVLGGGVSGVAVAELVRRLGGRALVYDERAGAGHSQHFDLEVAASHRLVVFSPGFSVGHSWLKLASAAGCVCLGELDFASLHWSGFCLAITGTNGKTTLTEFLVHALRSAGESAFATGNVGHPFSKLVVDSDGGLQRQTAVCEVSSFQAETLWHFRAGATLWTNFAEDHLERHPGMRSYFSAKAGLLCSSPGQIVLAGSSVTRHASSLGFVLPERAEVRTEGLKAEERLRGTVFEDYPQRENFELARAWWRLSERREEALLRAAESFQLGPHRLCLVAEIAGVRWWNDSKATNFHAVEGALARFERPVFLIAGGKAKGGDIEGFARRIASRLKGVFAIGETRDRLAAGFASASLCCQVCSSMQEAVAAAASAAGDGDQVLLSPGFASFDMFRGYDHRGTVFETLVRDHLRETTHNHTPQENHSHS